MVLARESVDLIKIDYAYEYIELFIRKQTENTGKAYKTALTYFFKEVYDKEPKFVTIRDLENTKMKDIVKYHLSLSSKFKTNTVNKHFNGVKSFFKFMSNEFKTIDEKIFNGVDLKKPELDASSWDSLTWMEAIQIWEYAQEHFGEESNRLAMLFKLASITSIRLEALLSSEWEKDWYVKNENGVDIHFIEVIDKEKIHKKPISTSFYNELREKLGTSGKLFPKMYPNKVGARLKKILKELDFDPRRNIKFHSFKKAGVMRALSLTGNMYKAKEQGNHSSMTTSEKYYLKYKECLTDMTSYYMDEDIDVEVELEQYSKEEIIQAIKQMNEGARVQLVNILKG